MPSPTPEAFDALTAYLPVLYAPGFRPVVNWQGGLDSPGGATLPYPEYDPAVERFFGAVSEGGWLDTGYDPERAWALIKEPGRMAAADLAEVRQMLTFCVRGERFSDGHWAEMIETGVIRALLERLQQLRPAGR